MIEQLAKTAAWQAKRIPLVQRTLVRHPTVKFAFKAWQAYLTFLTLKMMFQKIKKKIKLAKIYGAIAAIVILLLIMNSILQTVKIYRLENLIEQSQNY